MKPATLSPSVAPTSPPTVACHRISVSGIPLFEGVYIEQQVKKNEHTEWRDPVGAGKNLFYSQAAGKWSILELETFSEASTTQGDAQPPFLGTWDFSIETDKGSQEFQPILTLTCTATDEPTERPTEEPTQLPTAQPTISAEQASSHNDLF